ncbi:hypothetical protein R5R35_006954 [Gryllus longicercus]|uniref:Uncharacterized protein n=1 Tax=Gryllus longicercus TaxID=2509291 RepID=A0AAN9VVK4_9ORTH
MKLSVSAFRAQASAHQKILSSSYQLLLNYGSTSATAAPGSAARGGGTQAASILGGPAPGTSGATAACALPSVKVGSLKHLHVRNNVLLIAIYAL